MKENVKTGPATHPNPSSFFTLATGWMQQGVESFFATQRILVDLAMRQNLNLMKTLRDDLADPERSPLFMLTELAAEGTSTFIETQRVLLDLAHRETELMMGGVKERVHESAPATAMAELVRRSMGTFITMQQDFLTTASKQASHWLHAVKSGNYYDSDHVVETAREAMDHFVRAQKKFLDVIAEEAGHATSERPSKDGKMKKMEVSKLAHEAANAFLEAQKKLLDVAGRQMNVNLRVAGRAMDVVKPLRLPLAAFTGENLRSFVDAEKALIDNMMKRHPAPHTKAGHKASRHARKPAAQASA